MAKTYYWILLNKKGNPITTDHKLPFYWNFKVAQKDAYIFKAYEIKRINIEDLQSFINNQI
jgi:hypothetical protein